MPWVNGGSPRTTTPEHRARRRNVLDRDDHQCRIRGPRCTRIATVADHIVALALGGTDTDDNMQAACAPCNQWKAALEANEAKSRLRNRKRSAPQPIGTKAWGTPPHPHPRASPREA